MPMTTPVHPAAEPESPAVRLAHAVGDHLVLAGRSLRLDAMLVAVGNGASFGGGLQFRVGSIGSLGIDYAYTALADLENVQVFTIQAKF